MVYMSKPSIRILGTVMLALALLSTGVGRTGEAEWQQAHKDAGTSACYAAD